MPHTYECPLRWADMDLLGHVNNVTYLDYLSEAREVMFAGHPAGRAPVASHRVEFVTPLVFRRAPVLVDSWVTDVDGDHLTLAQEVYDTGSVDRPGGPSRTVHLRGTTVLTHRLTDDESRLVEQVRGPAIRWRPLRDEARPPGHVYALTVRRSDLDERGGARSGVFFEYVQEARIRYLMSLHTRGEQWSQHVVARTDVDYLAPLSHRRRPYQVRSWVAHLGGRSFTIRSEVRDGDRVLARASVVMVTFDLETQRTTEMAPQQRACLEREMASEDLSLS